jgi:hypothetical protein
MWREDEIDGKYRLELIGDMYDVSLLPALFPK